MTASTALRSLRRLVDRLLGPIVALLGIRALDVYLERIGEIGESLELWVEMGALGMRPRYRAFLVAPPERVANRSYLEYWRPHVRIVDSGLALRLLRTAAWSPHLSYSPGGDGDRERVWVDVHRRWELEGRPPLLRLNADHEARGRARLRDFGLPDDAWFVTLHVREAGYLAETADSHRWFRNAEVDTYLPAVRRIVERGGWVVRLGDPTMKPLPPLEHVVDYAHHELRSDWMDVFLAGACRFILGTTSGMYVVAHTFGVPVAVANFVPPGAIAKSSHDVFIPKLYRRVEDGRFLSFAETLEPELAFEYDGRRLSEYGLEVVDNEADEIEGLADEMVERRYSDEDEELQSRYKALLQRYYVDGGVARVGRDFLRKHADLLAA